jgi:hypothetical protein
MRIWEIVRAYHGQQAMYQTRCNERRRCRISNASSRGEKGYSVTFATIPADASARSWSEGRGWVRTSAISLPFRPRGASPVPYSTLAVFWPSVAFFAPCFALFWLILAHLHRIFPYSGPIVAISQLSKMARNARYWPI